MPKNTTMRITGGSLVRRRFLIPPMVDEGTVRPTPDRVREAVFSMLAHKLLGAVVLDLFAGSGAHGFEALSRGAKKVRFIERDPRIASVIKENIKNLNLTKECSVEIDDARRVIGNPPLELADIIFVDPPYSLKLNAEFFLSLVQHLNENGVVVFRCFKKEHPLCHEALYIDRDRVYGNTRVFILRRTLT
jgi:16S rRNA (guanine966-N2)-methyltransferase